MRRRWFRAGPGDDADPARAARRLALQFTALTVVLLSLAGVVVYYLAAAGSEQALQDRLESAAALDNPRDAPLDIFLAVYDRGRLTVSRDMPEGLPVEDSMAAVAAGGGEVEETVEASGTTFRVLTRTDGRDIVQAAIDTSETRGQLDRLVLALVFAVLFSAAVAAAFSVLAARAAMRPLIQALELQRRFVSDASHELRTPLTLLSTRAQLLRRRLGSRSPEASPGQAEGAGARQEPPDRQILETGLDDIIADAGVLTGILEDLLESADPRRAGPPEPVDLAAAARQGAQAFRATMSERALQLKLDVPAAPVRVRAGHAAVQRVITALLSNAGDYARSTVWVQVSASGHDGVLRVSDDGPGLPRELRGRVFERFSSVRPTSGGHTRHYGLGLALVAEIASRYGGSVQAEPSHARGTSLTVRLPLDR
ncbi:HAMP domain-containing sensor histidine kinase [Arthrobacter koreensis]|uniref:sensor histidine kinase n=1 Tax=Arthrobacter koreensis TaxID=199136 RepID=UPI002DBF45F7|nr:HAMP domain-containing sensor histidine kinase [Arthrobacter koreensis]MEB7504906.1 HAMP domain-containing histidine kinase [Arthrobacter koreensis]